METLTIVALSLLAGFVAAGFVWFGWGLAENLLTMLAARKPRGAEPEGSKAEEAEEPKGE